MSLIDSSPAHAAQAKLSSGFRRSVTTDRHYELSVHQKHVSFHLQVLYPHCTLETCCFFCFFSRRGLSCFLCISVYRVLVQHTVRALVFKTHSQYVRGSPLATSKENVKPPSPGVSDRHFSLRVPVFPRPLRFIPIGERGGFFSRTRGTRATRDAMDPRSR